MPPPTSIPLDKIFTQFDMLPLHDLGAAMGIQDFTPDNVNKILASKAKAALQDTGIELTCRVEQNRWLADCLCNAGIAADPANPILICVECGRTYKAKFPTQPTIARATDALLLRGPLNRNWDPATELTTDLEQENRNHGIGPGGKPPNVGNQVKT